LQPAGCARRDQRDRARVVHRAHSQSGEERGAELPRQPRPPRLSDGAQGLGRRDDRAASQEGGLSTMSTMTTKNLLVELFVEELPPKALKKLGDEFAKNLAESLKAQGLAGGGAVVSAFASPRRLAVHVTGVAGAAADKAVS